MLIEVHEPSSILPPSRTRTLERSLLKVRLAFNRVNPIERPALLISFLSLFFSETSKHEYIEFLADKKMLGFVTVHGFFQTRRI